MTDNPHFETASSWKAEARKLLRQQQGYAANLR